MIDLALDTTGDIDAFAAGGAWISGLRRVAQELKIRLLTHLGEYFLDTRFGLDWTDWLSRKASSSLLREIEVTISREILATSGVTRIAERVTATFEVATRTIRIGFSCYASEEDEGVIVGTIEGVHPGALLVILLDPTGAIIA